MHHIKRNIRMFMSIAIEPLYDAWSVNKIASTAENARNTKFATRATKHTHMRQTLLTMEEEIDKTMPPVDSIVDGEMLSNFEFVPIRNLQVPYERFLLFVIVMAWDSKLFTRQPLHFSILKCRSYQSEQSWVQKEFTLFLSSFTLFPEFEQDSLTRLRTQVQFTKILKSWSINLTSLETMI